MGIYLGAGNVVVTEKFLDGPHVRDSQKTAGKSVSEHVRIDSPANRFKSGGVYDVLDLAGSHWGNIVTNTKNISIINGQVIQ